jgi:hypothetical protein
MAADSTGLVDDISLVYFFTDLYMYFPFYPILRLAYRPDRSMLMTFAEEAYNRIYSDMIHQIHRLKWTGIKHRG